jgi:subtilisin family serine protease
LRNGLHRWRGSGLILGALWTAAALAPPAHAAAPARYRPGRVIVRFSGRTSTATARAAAVGHVESSGARGVRLVRVRPGRTVGRELALLRRRRDVAWAEPDYLYRIQSLPDDPRFAQQWALHNTGQSVAGIAGTPGADVDAPSAWDVLTDITPVTVAVVDTGIAYDHPELSSEIWKDRDGFNGCDATGFQHDPYDGNGHGTHVAGIIGALGNNLAGVAGVGWESRLMAVKAIADDGVSDAMDIAGAFDCAAAQGARVVNASIAGLGHSNDIAEAVRYHPGTLFVVAAGNDGHDVDGDYPTAPCDDTNDNLVCVTATDSSDRLAKFGNFGTASVDLAAPGTEILSTYLTEEELFRDDFEHGVANWSIDSGWRTSTAWSASPTHSLLADSSCNAFATCTARLDHAFDIGSRKGCLLNFSLDLHLQAGAGGMLSVGYGTDNSPGPTEWAEFTDSQTGTVSLSLGNLATVNPVRFSFEFRPAGGTGESAAIDDVRVDCPDRSGPADGYEVLSGTSMSAPFVAGAAALVMAHDPTATPRDVKTRLLGTVHPLPTLAGKTVSGGRLDIGAAVRSTARAPAPPPYGTITTVEGGGDAIEANGVKATDYTARAPLSVRDLPDGGFLYVDNDASRVWRVAPDGTERIVAGPPPGTPSDSQKGFSGDGGPATDAKLFRPWGLSVMRDGGFLVADWGNGRIRRVAPDGTITTVAGGGSAAVTDGARATDVAINEPLAVSADPDDDGFVFSAWDSVYRVSSSGTIREVVHGILESLGVAALPGGASLVSDRDNHRVRRYAADGTWTTAAGTGHEGFFGDGGPAKQAWLDQPGDIATTPDGGFLIADMGNHRVRFVDAHGTIRTLAGGPSLGFSGDGGSAGDAELHGVNSVSPAADGGLLVTDGDWLRIRHVTAPDAPYPLPSAGPFIKFHIDPAGNYAKALADPHGTASEAYFEWGTTTSYGQERPRTQLQTEPQDIVLSPDYLGPPGTYHVRLVVMNARGVAYGPDATLTTTADDSWGDPPPPPHATPPPDTTPPPDSGSGQPTTGAPSAPPPAGQPAATSEAPAPAPFGPVAPVGVQTAPSSSPAKPRSPLLASVQSVQRVRASTLLTRGVAARVTCSSACTLRATLSLGSRRPAVLGTARSHATAGLRVLVRVRPTAAGRRTLRTSDAFFATLRVTAVAGSRRASVTRTLLLSAPRFAGSAP